MKRLCLALLVLVVTGCNLIGRGDPNFTPVPTECTVPPVSNLSGAWTLDATGQRSQCSDGTFNGSFRLLNAAPLTVRQTGTDGGTPGDLALENPPTGFTLFGGLRGSCLEFEARETVHGETLRYVFEASLQQNDLNASGELRGNGPGLCQVSGTFDLSVRP